MWSSNVISTRSNLYRLRNSLEIISTTAAASLPAKEETFAVESLSAEGYQTDVKTLGLEARQR
jgi:hypothetical protein